MLVGVLGLGMAYRDWWRSGGIVRFGGGFLVLYATNLVSASAAWIGRRQHTCCFVG